MKIVYSPLYNVDLLDCVFPAVKYDLIYQKLIPEYEDIIITPKAATDSEVLLVHTKEYIEKLKTSNLTQEEMYKLELPYSEELIKASFMCAGGTILAIRTSLKEKICIHLGGGFHHSFSDHGEGFCVLNDIAIGIRTIQKEKLAKRFLVIDCDLHQGNGTADIFKDNRDVFTFSIHQENNYPMIKPKSSLDVGLPDGTGDLEYLLNLKTHINKVIEDFDPEGIVYIAGADPYQYDQLGGLDLTKEGLIKRDQYIFSLDIPTAVVLAGGYAENVCDTVEIHYNMVREAVKLVNQNGGKV